MPLSPKTVRRAAAVVGTGAALLFSANTNSALACGSPNTVAGLQCRIDESKQHQRTYIEQTKAAERRGAEADRRGAEADRRGADADKRGAEADKRGAEIDVVKGCTGFLLSLPRANVLEKAAGNPITEQNACSIAKSLGYKQASL
jgi:hypothetical protein